MSEHINLADDKRDTISKRVVQELEQEGSMRTKELFNAIVDDLVPDPVSERSTLRRYLTDVRRQLEHDDVIVAERVSSGRPIPAWKWTYNGET